MTDAEDRVATAPASLAAMTSHTGLEVLQSWATGRRTLPSHMADLGLSVATASFGSVTLRWNPTASLEQEDGTIRDSVVPLVCAEAASLAAASLGLRFRPMRTLDLHATCLRPTFPAGECLVRAEVAHSGTARIIVDARVEDAEGRLVARSTGTFAPVPMEVAPTATPSIPEPREEGPAASHSEPQERGLWVPVVPAPKDLVAQPTGSRATADNLRPADVPALAWGGAAADGSHAEDPLPPASW